MNWNASLAMLYPEDELYWPISIGLEYFINLGVNAGDLLVLANESRADLEESVQSETDMNETLVELMKKNGSPTLKVYGYLFDMKITEIPPLVAFTHRRSIYAMPHGYAILNDITAVNLPFDEFDVMLKFKDGPTIHLIYNKFEEFISRYRAAFDSSLSVR